MVIATHVRGGDRRHGIAFAVAEDSVRSHDLDGEAIGPQTPCALAPMSENVSVRAIASGKAERLLP